MYPFDKFLKEATTIGYGGSKYLDEGWRSPEEAIYFLAWSPLDRSEEDKSPLYFYERDGENWVPITTYIVTSEDSGKLIVREGLEFYDILVEFVEHYGLSAEDIREIAPSFKGPDEEVED